MSSIEVVGLLAGFLTTISLIPQITKIIRSKSAHDLSYGMYGVYAAGVFLWFVYGILLRAFPLIFWNGMGFLLACLVIVLKVIYDRSEGTSSLQRKETEK